MEFSSKYIFFGLDRSLKLRESNHLDKNEKMKK